VDRIALSLLCGLFTLTLSACGVAGFGEEEARYNGTYLEGEQEQQTFSLVGADGQPVNIADYRGQLVVMYFGYTFCPDVCPLTMAKLAEAREQLGDNAEDVQVFMITVDPERDSPQRVQEYVQRIDPSFTGLGGSPEQLSEVATKLGIFVQKQLGSEATGYLVDHTASVLVLDQEGMLRLVLPFDLTAEQVASDLENLL
jgi:protein SCO1/2